MQNVHWFTAGCSSAVQKEKVGAEENSKRKVVWFHGFKRISKTSSKPYEQGPVQIFKFTKGGNFFRIQKKEFRREGQGKLEG